MCRLLYVKSKYKFEIVHYLQHFAQIAKNSKEYQGHGWGLAYLYREKWHFYKNIKPIWEDDLNKFGKTELLMAHARSAFRDMDITVNNNMPFYDKKYVYIFNGELHGVKIKEKGRIGAEKIFNFIQRFDPENIISSIRKGLAILEKRTRYVKAINFIIADKINACVVSYFNEDDDYFTMFYKKTQHDLVICSEKFNETDDWVAIKNKTIRKFE
jgi:glutamine amidotransferase